MSYLQLFAQSLILELIPAALLFRSVPFFKLLVVVFLANALTHPWVVFFWTALPGAPLIPALLFAEFFAFSLEGYCYARAFRCGWLRAGLVALAVNIISWQFGPVLSYGLARVHGIF